MHLFSLLAGPFSVAGSVASSSSTTRTRGRTSASRREGPVTLPRFSVGRWWPGPPLGGIDRAPGNSPSLVGPSPPPASATCSVLPPSSIYPVESPGQVPHAGPLEPLLLHRSPPSASWTACSRPTSSAPGSSSSCDTTGWVGPKTMFRFLGSRENGLSPRPCSL